MMRARAKFAAEALAAVAKQGQKVCREMEVGIGGRDWVRGVVVGVRSVQTIRNNHMPTGYDNARARKL